MMLSYFQCSKITSNQQKIWSIFRRTGRLEKKKTRYGRRRNMAALTLLSHHRGTSNLRAWNGRDFREQHTFFSSFFRSLLRNLVKANCRRKIIRAYIGRFQGDQDGLSTWPRQAWQPVTNDDGNSRFSPQSCDDANFLCHTFFQYFFSYLNHNPLLCLPCSYSFTSDFPKAPHLFVFIDGGATRSEVGQVLPWR